MWVSSDPVINNERLKTLPYCTLCDETGHNIRYCMKKNNAETVLTEEEMLFSMLISQEEYVPFHCYSLGSRIYIIFEKFLFHVISHNMLPKSSQLLSEHNFKKCFTKICIFHPKFGKRDKMGCWAPEAPILKLEFHIVGHTDMLQTSLQPLSEHNLSQVINKCSPKPHFGPLCGVGSRC